MYIREDKELNTEVYEQCHQRRQRLGAELPPSSIVILPSAEQSYRNGDTEYPFRQNSNFYYLTGFDEPDAVLVLKKLQANENPTGNAIEYFIFCRPHQIEEEVWTGPRMGVEGAIKQLGANKAYPIETLDKVMPELLENTQHIVFSLGQNLTWDTRVTGWINTMRGKSRGGISEPRIWLDLVSIIHELRLIKDNYEIKLLRKASQISVEAHKRLMHSCNPNQKEYELEAEFLHECYKQGCRAVAYSSIIAGGANACTLHYTKNDKTLKDGELVLVDAGGEYQNYASDITRTFPVNGRFTEDQKRIYELVLKAQLAAIEEIRPGVRYDKMQEVIVLVLVRGLVELHILNGKIEDLIEQKAYKQFYMHSSGHWLGLDVHDAGEYKQNGEWRTLMPGMVLTVEPGIYITPGQKDIDKRWWGIGVRIEDDVLVTEAGHEVLTRGAPKTVESIEHIMQKEKA